MSQPRVTNVMVAVLSDHNCHRLKILFFKLFNSGKAIGVAVATSDVVDIVLSWVLNILVILGQE
jgi:hypothetical protein